MKANNRARTAFLHTNCYLSLQRVKTIDFVFNSAQILGKKLMTNVFWMNLSKSVILLGKNQEKHFD